MTDAELVAKLRTWILHEDVSAESLMNLAADRLEALAFQLVGEEKARHLLLKGMESQCELMDGLKQDVRRLAAERDAARKEAEELYADFRECAADRDAAWSERDAAVKRAAELEAALKPFIANLPDDRIRDGLFYAVPVTGDVVRRATALLAPADGPAAEGGGP